MSGEGSAESIIDNSGSAAPRLLFVAGGTGGHLFPALAVADRCRELSPDAVVRFVGAEGRIEEEIVPRAGYELDLLWISGFDRKLSLRNLLLPFKVLGSVLRARKIIRSFRPDVVICAGAYVSYPVGLAASMLGIPLVLMGSDALPGMALRKLAPKATEIHAAFDESKRYLPPGKVKVSGNPIRAVFSKRIDRAEARRHFGLSPDRPTLFVFGGSLGARSINRVLDGLVGALLSEGIQVIWQTGRSYEGEERREEGLYRTTFLHEMEVGYAAADLIVARAGATTIAELKAVGKPAILVPLPTAADDHQRVNAEVMEKEGAAATVLDSDLGNRLYGTIVGLLSQPLRLAEMGEHAARMAVPDADTAIAGSLLAIARRKDR